MMPREEFIAFTRMWSQAASVSLEQIQELLYDSCGTEWGFVGDDAESDGGSNGGSNVVVVYGAVGLLYDDRITKESVGLYITDYGCYVTEMPRADDYEAKKMYLRWAAVTLFTIYDAFPTASPEDCYVDDESFVDVVERAVKMMEKQ